jgi:TnsA endonuclease N terminal
MRKNTIQPVRKISIGTSSMRGKTYSLKNGRHNDFESALERDFLQVLEFDSNVWYYCEQPITIEYELMGIVREYTPDVLIYYREDIEPANKFKPMLCEVKYRKDLKENWKELKPKFMAALRYADAQGWKFKIITEKEIMMKKKQILIIVI